MAACARLFYHRNVFPSVLSRFHISRACTSSVAESRTADESEIIVPYRIQRGPTDILKALATTINRDFTAAHHKYHDDPYFIPLSNASKRSLALSKESGRKAARYFLEKYPHFFKFNTSEPRIKAFDPPTKYSETDNISEKTLKECAESFDVTNALCVFNILDKKGVSVSQDTKQMLLELLCFYSSDQTPNMDYVEERFFALRNKNTKNVWKNFEVSLKLFNEMDQDSSSYCTMIQGASKHQHADKAFSWYEEMKSKNLPANTQTYNSLLSLVPIMKENGDLRWESAMDLVSNMNQEGLFPDLYTMNALLSIASKSFRWKKDKAISLNILAEMKRLDIEPSLGTYSHILRIFFKDSASHFSVFTQIMEKLEGREFQIRHPDDVLFFVIASAVCYKHNRDKDLGYRLLALLELGKNSDLVGGNFAEATFYKHIFKLFCETEDFEKLMEFYHKYVPNVYTPETSVMLDILLALELSGGYRHLPIIGRDLFLFELATNEELINEFFHIASSMKYEPEIQQPLVELAWKFLTMMDRALETAARLKVQLTGNLLGNILRIFLNGQDAKKSWDTLSRLVKNEGSIIGYPENEILLNFCTLFLEAKDFEKVRFCVKYSENSCYPAIRTDLEQVIMKLYDSQKLSSNERDEACSTLSIYRKQELRGDPVIKDDENKLGVHME